MYSRSVCKLSATIPTGLGFPVSLCPLPIIDCQKPKPRCTGRHRIRHARSSLARILDQCFVTRRDAYETCAGFRPELGHFAEWVLAANYFRCGYKLGYCPEARFHHYYTGSLAELREFTLDFVAGEIRYFSELSAASDSLLEPPSEWMCQGNFDRDTARSILAIAVKSLWSPPRRFARHFQHSTARSHAGSFRRFLATG